MCELFDDNRAILSLDRIDPKYRPVWEHLAPEHWQALADYFLPHRSAKSLLAPTRPRVIKWYCPFACQKVFASGHRYCINIYTGCQHGCVYCYAAAYQPANAGVKASFEKLLGLDLADLERFAVPPAPVHISNSTDPFQPLELQFGYTRLALEQILRHRHRFTTVTILTKNPLFAARCDYLDLFRRLADIPKPSDRHPGLTIEVSLAFLQEAARKVYDPAAPSVAERMEGIRLLHGAGIPVVLRIDPLFPRSPITESKDVKDFDLPEAQTLDDLDTLVAFAKENGVRHIVYSPAKLVQSRSRPMSDTMHKLKTLYQAYAAPEKLTWQSGSWRLPHAIAMQKIVTPFLALCQTRNIEAKFCKQNLLDTR
ncbi:MAG: hypothetical protein LLF76_14430 [Planctomycetaceae bacterium]|nr:hypothetical protein [Planctomycetaceae bacterium]